MQKEVLKKLEYDMFIVLISLVLTAIMYFLVTPSLTGYVVFQPTLSASSTINTSNNEYKLTSYTTISYIINELYTESTLTQATYSNDDVLSKVNTLDNDIVHADKDKIFNIKFNKALNNNDKIYFKPKSSDSSEVYLCDENIQCSYPGYGSVQYNGDDSWYSIKLSSLQSNKDSFNLDPVKVKFDFINASKNETTIQTNSSIFYNKSGTVETQDIQPSDLSKWDMFSSSYTLNSQNIIFEYSTDSGLVWNLIPSNNNLSSVNSPKIKIRANLTSNGISPPILYNMYINYSISCSENWTCNSWSACNVGIQTRTCTDNNICNTLNNKPVESQSCFYAKNFYLLNQSNTITMQENILTTLNYTNIQLKIKTSQNKTVLFEIQNYSNHSTLPSTLISASKFIDIASNISDLLEATIRVYYDGQSLGNIDETTLKLYYFNSSTSSWEAISTTINAESNYLESNLIHFSTYGIFGSEKSASSESKPRQSDSKQPPPPTSLPKSPTPVITQSAPSQPTVTSTTTPTAQSKPAPSQPTTVTPPSQQAEVTGRVIDRLNPMENKLMAFAIMGLFAIVLLIILKIEHSRHKKNLNNKSP